MTTKKAKLKSDLMDLILEEDFSKEEITDVSESEKSSRDIGSEKTSLVQSQSNLNIEKEATAALAKVKKKISSVFEKEEENTNKITSPTLEQNPSSMTSHYQQKVERAQALQLAQNRIQELETLNAKLEYELSELHSSGEVLYTQNQDLKAEIERLKRKINDLKENHKTEVEILESKVTAKDKQLDKLKLQIDSLELQLKVEFQKVKSRERELENRLEIMKMENQAVLRSKDELILELKRNLDEISIEMENYKGKGRDLHLNFEQTKEKMRKSVKALRLALSLLENEEDTKSIEENKKESA